MYVAHISSNALTAVSIVFPFQLLMIAVATGSGVGINIVVFSLLGKKEFVNAGKAAKSSLILAASISRFINSDCRLCCYLFYQSHLVTIYYGRSGCL